MSIYADIPVDNTWKSIYLASGIDPSSITIKIQNKGSYPVILSISPSLPAQNDYDGFVLETKESIVLPLGTVDAFVRCNGDAHVSELSIEDSRSIEDAGTLPSDLYSSTKYGVRRLQVDISQTGFWDGREFRIFEPIDLSGTGRKVIKIVATTNFILRWQAISAKSGSIIMKAYRLDDGGTDSGVWTDTIYKLPNNIMSDVEPYTAQVAYQTGGNFVPTDANLYRDKLEVLVTNATAQQSTVGANTAQERGLSTNTYYLVFTGNGVGDFFSIIEERV